MGVSIRAEKKEDQHQVRRIIELAFKNVEGSDQSEGALVARLRASDAFVPELSLVALSDQEIVGHILFTRISIVSDNEVFENVLALAPVSVHPIHQGKGIGGLLIEKGHEIAQKLGFKGVVLLGHENYYPRFGYEPASNFGIKAPWDVPDRNYMVKALAADGLVPVTGTVRYASAFFE